jgi:hypothetical protein
MPSRSSRAARRRLRLSPGGYLGGLRLSSRTTRAIARAQAKAHWYAEKKDPNGPLGGAG